MASKYFDYDNGVAAEYARRWVYDDKSYTAEDIDKISGLADGHTREYLNRENLTALDPDNVTKEQFSAYTLAFIRARIEDEPAFAGSFLFDLYARAAEHQDEDIEKFVEAFIPKAWWAGSWDTPQGLGWMNVNGVYWK